MFALPPPPTGRYGGQNGMPPVLETHNVLKRLEGPEYTLQVGEGTYILRDDLQLSTPPPHPSEAPPTNPNPLATTASPPTGGVKLSLVSITPTKSIPNLDKSSGLKNGMFKWKTLGLNIAEKEVQKPLDTSSETSRPSTEISNSDRSSNVPKFGEGNVALTPTLGRNTAKKTSKPKNNIVKSNSSFVSRVIPHDSLAKRLAEREPSGIFAFANINRAFQWLDLSSNVKQEPLSKILFTKAHMLCHDVNSATKTVSHLDVVMGSSAGDIIWYEPMSQKYARINKNGMINNTPVSCLKWIPGSENLFLAAHMDGTLMVYDKEKEDAPFTSEEGVVDEAISIEDDDQSTLIVTKSVNSSNQKANPVAAWKVSSHKIHDFAFSPDARHLAVVSEDGSLHVIDYLQERLTDIYPAYYGGFICVCWSPDGKYILTGGQDDLVSIWSLSERSIVARCYGHDSWVTAVAFDPWRCDERNYRFGSVGDDCKLLLWDFSVGMLHRPKGTTRGARGSISTQSISLTRQRGESSSVIQRFRSDSNRSQTLQQDVTGEPSFIKHPLEPRSRTAQLPPVMTKAIDNHPLCWLAFDADCIYTSCQEGHIRTWDRPRENVNASQINLSTSVQSS